MVQGRIVIDSERCKGCELCTSVCPQNVIRISSAFNSNGYKPAELVDPLGACTGCAITVYRQVRPRTAGLHAV